MISATSAAPAAPCAIIACVSRRSMSAYCGSAASARAWDSHNAMKRRASSVASGAPSSVSSAMGRLYRGAAAAVEFRCAAPEAPVSIDGSER